MYKKLSGIVLIGVLFLGAVYYFSKEHIFSYDIVYSQGQGTLTYDINSKMWCLTNRCGYMKKISDSEFEIKWIISNKFKKDEKTGVFEEQRKEKVYPLPKEESMITLPVLEKDFAVSALKCSMKDGACFANDEQKAFLEGFAVSGNKKITYMTNLNHKPYWYMSGVPYQPEGKDKRFYLALASYNRPVFLSGQVLRLLNQRYQNFHIGISIKGFSKEEATDTILQEWQPFQEKLSVRFDENKTQFSNLLDTFRKANLENYDYVCRIDDDDWYGPDYLFHLNNLLKAFDDVAITSEPMFYQVSTKKGEAVLQKTAVDHHGSTLCFSRDVAKFLLAVEKMSESELNQLGSDVAYKIKNPMEDELIMQLALRKGPILIRQMIHPQYFYNKQYPSISRPDEM